ncbi:MAG: hypothetical protein ABI395_05550 [Sphingobium sp.]
MRESDETKKKRLAESLRANLRRRKAQGKAHSEEQRLPDPTSDGSTGD